jgi:hypothetical protein
MFEKLAAFRKNANFEKKICKKRLIYFWFILRNFDGGVLEGSPLIGMR